MPQGLDIDREHDLNGSMATYARHVVVFTGQEDWKSRVEQDGTDTAWGNMTRALKRMTTRGGEYADPFNNIMITTSTFSPNPTPKTQSKTAATALVFPDGLLLRDITTNDENDSSLRTLIEEYLTGKTAEQEATGDATPITQPTILICGHGGRDQRCGILGPILQTEFEMKLAKLLPSSQSPQKLLQDDTPASIPKPFSPTTPQVGLISHIGGHKFAGNIILYIPPSYNLPKPSTTEEAAQPHPLAGKGIWYGRVEPRHVEGIIQETIIKGNVIKEFFRGGVGMGGEVLRMPLELKARKR